ncbi:MAG: BrnT family toxin [Vitreimonas sp.]
MRYEWDKAKAAANRRLHGIAFQDAIGALEDPNRIEEADDRFDYEEDRDVVIGMSSGGVLFVVATYRDENTRRIISARRATKHEEDRYHAGDREIW